MTDDLKLPQVGELTLPRWQHWLARYNAVLSEKSDRIEKLEAALREIADCVTLPAQNDCGMREIAHKALNTSSECVNETGES